VSEPRFYVVELEGYAIRPGAEQAGNARLLLTASVLDRAYCHREVARFDQPRALPGLRRGAVTRKVRLDWVRSEAARRCAELNEWAASA
jgi:hypothetical protein